MFSRGPRWARRFWWNSFYCRVLLGIYIWDILHYCSTCYKGTLVDKNFLSLLHYNFVNTLCSIRKSNRPIISVNFFIGNFRYLGVNNVIYSTSLTFGSISVHPPLGKIMVLPLIPFLKALHFDFLPLKLNLSLV